MNTPLPPISLHTVLTTWTMAPLLTEVLVVAAALYLLAVSKVVRSGGHWPIGRTISFAVGLLVVAFTGESWIEVYGMRLFEVHMLAHLLLIMVVPPLLVMGRVLTLLREVSPPPVRAVFRLPAVAAVVKVLTSPAVGLGAYAVVVVYTHLTNFMNDMVVHPVLHDLETITYIGAGYLLFLNVVGGEPIPWNLSPPARIFLLIGTMPVDTFTGLVLDMTTYSMFPKMAALRPAWAPSAISEQHLGGGVMWIGGAGIMAAYIIVLVGSWMRMPERSAVSRPATFLERARVGTLAGFVAPEGPQAAQVMTDNLDFDEAALSAYNARLARMYLPPPARPARRPAQPPPG